MFFFFQAEDGIRDHCVTGVQTCALPISLSTGIRTPVGVKVFGKDLGEIENLSRQIEAVIRKVPGTTSAYAERVIGGYYLNVDPDRTQLARYGLMVDDIQNVIAMALGAEAVTTTV